MSLTLRVSGCAASAACLLLACSPDRDFGSEGMGGAGSGGAGVGASSGSGGKATGGTGGTGGSAGTGGVAGTGGSAECASGLTSCGGECVNLDADGAHCGECDRACEGDLVCQDGECSESCDASLTRCGSSCVDVMSNAAHCSGCGMACPAPASNGAAFCSAGVCDVACGAGYEPCQGECVDLESDEANCGGCGVACSGECLSGECCPSDRTNCSGICVDTNSSAENCGACGTPCPLGEVCEGGSCATDCQQGTRCGNDCVDVNTDLQNCRTCGTVCQPPASNGSAVCGASGCDIACNAGVTRCGDVCCAPAPANAATSCAANGSCQVSCNTNFHACSGTSAPCYADSDATHCGAGCADCTQPNATAACVGGQCQNTCKGYTFACPGQAGKPACGSWDFESGTTEGWVLWNHTASGNTVALPSALTGSITNSTAVGTSRSLAVGHSGDGVDRFLSELKIRLCPSGQALNLEGRTLTFTVYAQTAPGTQPWTGNDSPNYFLTWNGANVLTGFCDYQLQPDTLTPVSCSFFDTAVTDVSLLMRVFTTWRGTFYFDNFQFQ